MAQIIAVRGLNRSSNVRLVDVNGNKVKASPTTDIVIDLDLASNRVALAHHSSIGQYIVSAANAATGAVSLPVNS